MARSSEETSLARAWLLAVEAPAIVSSLEAIYAAVAVEIARRGPSCWASGRCCNFKRTGHLLYVTGLEAAYTVRHLNEPLTPVRIDAALVEGGCPLQSANLCGVHPIRPLGCRVYFCDRSAQEWQQDLYERHLGQVRDLHDQHGIDYRYAEWRALLAWVTEVAAAQRSESRAGK